MAWSMVVAEPIGVIVGIFCGRLAANHGREIARKWGWPEVIGGMAGAALGHYLANAATKLVINIAMADAVGAGANVTVTSPTTSLIHALAEGISQVVPGLGDVTIQQAIAETLSTPVASEALQQYSDAVTSLPQSDGYYQPYSDPTMLQVIADAQMGPTCGLETVENLAQISCPGVDNALSDRCITAGWLDQNGHLPMERYQPLLQSIGIPSQWIDARDFQTMLNVVSQPGCAIGLYGDAFYLDEAYQTDPASHEVNPSRYFHAITLTEPYVNGQGRVVGFIGLDSNRPGQPMFYGFEKLWKFIEGSLQMAGPFAMQALAVFPGSPFGMHGVA